MNFEEAVVNNKNIPLVSFVGNTTPGSYYCSPINGIGWGRWSGTLELKRRVRSWSRTGSRECRCCWKRSDVGFGFFDVFSGCVLEDSEPLRRLHADIYDN